MKVYLWFTFKNKLSSFCYFLKERRQLGSVYLSKKNVMVNLSSDS